MAVRAPGAAVSVAWRDAGQAGTVALLGLNLLLLAFFILLTALAHFEERRVEQVVRSVNATFNGKASYTRPSEGISSGGPSALSRAAPLLDELDRLIRTTLPTLRVERAASGRELRLELDRELVFTPDSAQLRVSAELLLDRLARALHGRRDAALSYEIDLLYGVAGEDAGEAAMPSGLPVSRAVALVGGLVARGIPAARLSSGLLPGAAGRVRLNLRLGRMPAAPAGEG